MLVRGYHGTSEGTALEIEATCRFKVSRRPGLWLGHGVYFYQEAHRHAKTWALKSNDKVKILWADIEINGCLDLIGCSHWSKISGIFKSFQGEQAELIQLSVATNFLQLNFSDKSQVGYNRIHSELIERIFRERDMHFMGARPKKFTAIRAAFEEGSLIRKTSPSHQQSCIIISIIDSSAIKRWGVYENGVHRELTN